VRHVIIGIIVIGLALAILLIIARLGVFSGAPFSP
jgi:hypothetical protein